VNSNKQSPGDILILTADGTIERIVKTIVFRRYRSLGLSSAPSEKSVQIVSHPGRDPGVYSRIDLLRQISSPAKRHIIILDEEWEGSPGSSQIIQSLAQKLNNIGFNAAPNKVIVATPSIDGWVWGPIQCFLEEIQWLSRPGVNRNNAYSDLLSHLEDAGYELQNTPCKKPKKPKAALEYILSKIQRPRAREFYVRIAECAGIRNCCDPSFNDLIRTLHSWLNY